MKIQYSICTDTECVIGKARPRLLARRLQYNSPVRLRATAGLICSNILGILSPEMKHGSAPTPSVQGFVRHYDSLREPGKIPKYSTS